MPPVQSALAQVGIATQSAKGTPTANPTFAHGISGGGVLKSDISQDRADVTSGQRVAFKADRTQTTFGFDVTSRAFTRSIGLWLYLALGARSVTGAGPYTHTITPATTLPLATFWGWLDSNIVNVRDCMVDELELSWDADQPLEIKASGMGTVPLLTGATFVPTTDETKGSYFIPSGGTFKTDLGSATAVTAKIAGGSVKIANNLAARDLSGTVLPDEVFPGRQDHDVSMKLIPDDLTDWRKVITGTGSGTTVSETPPLGSFEFTFVDGTNSLKLAATNVAFVADFPDANPSGGPVELDVSGITLQPSGSALTVTLINGQATY